MKTTTAFALETLSVFDPVKITLSKDGEITCKKCKSTKPNGLSMTEVIKYDPTNIYLDTPTVGNKIHILQQGTIPHREDLNYRLNDKIYCKNGKLTKEKTNNVIGKVIPQGIYIDFLSTSN